MNASVFVFNDSFADTKALYVSDVFVCLVSLRLKILL